MITLDLFTILIFLIPGLISSIILNTLVIRNTPERDFMIIIEALVFSMFEYAIYAIFTTNFPISRIEKNGSLFYSINVIYFGLLVVIAIILPVLISISINNDIHMRFARYLQISKKTARNSVWNDVFLDNKKYVIIDFSNGRRIYGWPLFYSDNPDNSFIYLYKPYWINNNKFVKTDISGILITPEQKIDFIEFVDA